MKKPDSVNEQKQKEDREKFEKATLVDTSVLTVKRGKDHKVDLRSPDDNGKWVKDPDEIREQRKAARRLKAKKNKKEERG